MSIITNGTRQQSNYLRKVIEPYKREYRQAGLLGKLVGSKNRAIWGKILQRNAGEKIVFNQMQHFLREPQVGANYNNRLISDGNEYLNLATDEVKIESFRFDSKLLNQREYTQKTGYDLWPEVKYDLLENGRKLKENALINCLTNSFKGNPAEYDGTGMNVIMHPTTIANTIKNGNFNETDLTSLSKDRFLFGKDDIEISNSVIETLKQVVANDINNGKLTSETLYKLSVLASNGSREPSEYGTYENAIEPHSFGTHNLYEDRRYILITTDKAYQDLMKDADWKAHTQRGVIENATQPSTLFNTNYKGSMFGISVIVDNSLNKMSLQESLDKTSGDKETWECQINYSVLLGAGAFGYAIGGEPILIEDKDDYNNVKGICHDEISGLKVLKFPSRKVDKAYRGQNHYPHVENGLIHVLNITPIKKKLKKT